MIYTSPIESLTWENVQQFCEQGVVEGTHLDYEVDFPSDLAKTIAAMANTLGGLVLIGVEEGPDGRPVVPAKGITMEKGLSERVTNIVLSNIAPPVFPEVALCVNEAGDRAILAIRVPQSPEAPHAIQGNTRVYTRTANRNKPEELAAFTQIEWLQAKRAKAVALREQIAVQATIRSNGFFGLHPSAALLAGDAVQSSTDLAT